MKFRSILLLAIVVLSYFNCFAQQYMGAPLLRNYAPIDYKAEGQCLGIIQDSRGYIYFGVSSGIIEYNGSDFRPISVANNSVARSFAIDSLGRIYVGADCDFGYLEPDDIGLLQYKSISSQMDESDRFFGAVGKTFATSEGIYLMIIFSVAVQME